MFDDLPAFDEDTDIRTTLILGIDEHADEEESDELDIAVERSAEFR